MVALVGGGACGRLRQEVVQVAAQQLIERVAVGRAAPRAPRKPQRPRSLPSAPHPTAQSRQSAHRQQRSCISGTGTRITDCIFQVGPQLHCWNQPRTCQRACTRGTGLNP